MMSGKYIDEEKKRYSDEFCSFIIEKVKLAGGSLQYIHLFCLLQQVRFEIRNTFGTTKNEVLKFLKEHPEVFKIDSKGVITEAGSYAITDDCCDTDKNNWMESKKTLRSKIENGVGFITNIHTNSGIIKAIEPEETYVYFTPPEYTGNKDSLFIDCDLEINTEVYFNAVCGHNDYELEYCATKVWRKFDTDDENYEIKEDERNKMVNSNLKGVGVIQKLFSNLGFISVFGKEKETVFFHENSVKDCDNVELTKLFKVGDCVEFSASRSEKKDSKAQWQAEIVRKKTKKVSSPSCSRSDVNKCLIDVNKSRIDVNKSRIDVNKSRIENERGKICPHSHGAVIKFGKDYSEQADGDSSDYFLFGAKVSDIAWEFSAEDDVYFDAVKTKSALGWKAILVWVGEKPTHINENKVFSDEQINESFDDNSCMASDVSSIRSRTIKSESSERIKKRGKPIDNSVSGKVNENERFKKQNSKSSNSSLQTFSPRKSKSRPEKSESVNEYSLVDKYKRARSRSAREQEEINDVKREILHVNKYKSARCMRNRKLNEISSPVDGNNEGHILSKDEMSDISQSESQDSFEDESEVQSTLHNINKLGKEEKFSKSFISTSMHITDSSETAFDNKNNEIKCHKNSRKVKTSIKKFEDIDGEIINLYCKAAIITSSHLHKDVDFVLNAFYLDGKSVEEQEVIDLKEIIKVGDKIKFNCFEIIDDLGEIHQKVTMAWKGPKPKVYEMTPEEFITEYELSVSVRDESDSECVEENKSVPLNFLTIEPHSDETLEIISNTKSSSLDDISDSEIFENSRTETHENFDFTSDHQMEKKSHMLSSDEKKLSDIIIQRLKNKDFTIDSEIDLSDALTEIYKLVLNHCNLRRYNLRSCTCAEKRGETNRKTKDAEVQTIITGGIVAQNSDMA